jgi:glyceraldehyde 3-phosphate dehydrogenase
MISARSRPMPTCCALTACMAAFPAQVKVDGDTMIAATGADPVTAIKNPAELPHKELNVDIALECTGIFTTRDKAAAHLTAGAKRVLVSAPCEGADLTVVYGVNHDKLTKDHLVVSNASCTTNCLAPVAKVLNDAIGIDKGFMTTIHSYTGDQPTLDTMHKDLYRGRAAALSMIPTSTGAAKAVGLVIAGTEGQARRRLHPRADAECVGGGPQVHRAKRDHLGREINDGHQGRPRMGPLKGILGVHRPAQCLDRLQPRSAFVDLRAGPDQGDGRHVCAILSWYDNEWGFSNRDGRHGRGDGQAGD